VRTAYVYSANDSHASQATTTCKNTFKSILKSFVLSNRISRRLWTIWKEILSISKAYKILKTIDILIISGGGQLDDYWGGTWGHPYTLFKWAIIARTAKAKLVFLSVGAGSITSRLSRFFIKSSLLLASYRSYRERNTLTIVEAMGIRPGGMVYPDLAFSLPVRRDRIKGDSENERRPIIGISPISSVAWTGVDDPVYQNYFNQLVSLVSWLIQKKYRILFFPTQINADTPIITALKERLIRSGLLKSENEIIEKPVLTVDDLIEQISMVDMVVASRLHAVILSLLMHKPVLAISYNRKVNIAMGDMGLSEYCIDVNRIDLHSSIERFMMLESNAAAVTRQIEINMASYAKALNDQYRYVFVDKYPGESHAI
jgi:polysaccharide pyruvyl transferase WcaK-like protein